MMESLAHTEGTVLFVDHNVPYLPQPNTVEVVISHLVAPIALTATAFCVPVFDDGSVFLATNQRRGVEIPGGHVDAGETLEDAARRETIEEAGCEVGDMHPIGFLRMTISGTVPDGYRYPHPVSFQQFFAAKVAKISPYVHNAECGEPVRVYDLAASRRASIPMFVKAARDFFNG